MNKMVCELWKRGEQKKNLICLKLLAVAMLAVFLLPLMANANGVETIGSVSGTGHSGLTATWEGPLASLARSFTGPVAMALALIMIVVGVGVLMFGGDLSGWARWIAFALIAGGTLGGAGAIVGALNLSGAVV